jgi:hypothetical protein
MVVSVRSLPTERPAGLRLTSLDVEWFRLDEHAPASWSWSGFPAPRNRFDVSGRRVRYAARTERGACREHFAESARTITARHASLRVVRLTGRLRVVDLRAETTLDALGIDAEISTGRAHRVFDTCWVLGERLLQWYGETVHGIVYTSRTTPETSANLAFFRHSPVTSTSLGRLDRRVDLLAHLIADDGFRVDLPDWT